MKMKCLNCSFYIAVFLLLLLNLTACKQAKKQPPYVMPKDSLVNILTDFHIIEGIISFENSTNPNTAKYAEKYFNCYFEINNISRARYDSSMKYYYHKPKDIADVVNNNIVNRLSVMEAEIDKLLHYNQSTGNIKQ